MIEFPHSAPQGYSYEQVPFKANVTAIWIVHSCKYSYTNGRTVRSVWGFYNQKTKCFHAPINSKTVGEKVSIQDTTPYSAMQIKRTPLECAYV